MGQGLPTPPRADYGIDAPGVVLRLAFGGVACLVAGIVAYLALNSWQPGVAIALLNLNVLPGLGFLATALLMVWGSKVGKLRMRDRLLDSIPWRGDELVLDVGCGRGLMLLGAAKRLKTGKAVGIDLWQTEDQSGNRPETTWANARAEGVADRVEIKDGDARQLPFPEATFDVVVSSYCLHNICDVPGRRQGLGEVVRVLKPGGHVALVDIRHGTEYAQTLRDCGLVDVRRSAPNFLFLVPSYCITGMKSPAR